MRQSMKRVVLITGLIIFSLIVQSQIKFQNDANYARTYFDDQFDSAFNIKSVNDFEFRFTIIPSSIIPGRTVTLFILTHNNNQWRARLFQRINDAYSEKIVDSINLPNFWNQLLQQKILSIPNNISLKDKHGQIARSNMRDGKSYHFSLVSKIAKRSYSYYSPQSAMEEYPGIKVFSRVSKIIEIVKKYCSL